MNAVVTDTCVPGTDAYSAHVPCFKGTRGCVAKHVKPYSKRYLLIWLTDSVSGEFATLEELGAWWKKRNHVSKGSYDYVDTWNEPGLVLDDRSPGGWTPYWRWCPDARLADTTERDERVLLLEME